MLPELEVNWDAVETADKDRDIPVARVSVPSSPSSEEGEKEEGASSSGSEEESGEDDSDDEEELMRELERIKKERAAEAEKKEAERRETESARRAEALLSGNPLLAASLGGDPGSFNVKRRWDDDVVFRGQAGGPEGPPRKRFINDTIRSDFHKKFLSRYVK